MYPVAPATVFQTSWMLPVVWPALGLCAVADASVGAAGATVSRSLRALSAPVHILSTGVTVYCHRPAGTSRSWQASVAVVPLIVASHAAFGVTDAPPLAG